MLHPRLDILPLPQRDLWPDLATLPAGFVLYGGTALALRLAHRISEDFDFFSNQDFMPGDLEGRLSFLMGAVRLQSSPNTLVSLVDRGGPVKVSFFGGLRLRRVADPDPGEEGGIRVASLLDLAATKVKVVMACPPEVGEGRVPPRGTRQAGRSTVMRWAARVSAT